MSSYEEQFIKLLKKYRIKFEREKTYNDLKKGKYRYDFYLPEFNCLVEIDGQYHFYPICGRLALNKQQEHDRQKNDYALMKRIKLYRIPYWDLNSIKTIQDFQKSQYLVKSKFHNDYIMYEKNIPRN